MYIGGTLQSDELTRAQAAQSVLSILPSLVSAPLFTALFFGDKERMQAGFIVATVRTRVIYVAAFCNPLTRADHARVLLQLILMIKVPVVVFLMPREIPPKAPPRAGSAAGAEQPP